MPLDLRKRAILGGLARDFPASPIAWACRRMLEAPAEPPIAISSLLETEREARDGLSRNARPAPSAGGEA